ncbi:MAG TPA: ParB/RepB/Spo0J family partition protein [Bacillota bacterium]
MKSGGWLDWLSRRSGPAAGANLISLPVDRIDASPFQPRRTIDQAELEELAASVRQVGVLQPVVVRRRGDRYELVMGERRWLAARAAGLKEIPAVVRDLSDADAAVAALIENLQRSDLSFWDEAAGYARVIEEFGVTQEELAAAVGLSQSTVANKLRLLRLSDKVRRHAQSAGLGERHVRALLRLPDEQAQLEALAEVVGRDLSARETEALVAERVGSQAPGDGHASPAGSEDTGAVAGPRGRPQRPAPAPGGRSRRLPVIRDVRILLNTFRQGVDALRKAGLDANLEVREQEDRIEVTIRIPRR